LLNSTNGFDQSSVGSFLIDAPFIPGGRFTVLPNGNIGIGTSSPTNKLHVIGGVSATAFVTTSDRNAKENFASVSPSAVLDKVMALPITTWNFKDLHDGRHMGPMAQDFYAAFHLGGSDTTITTVDPDGVALAAIQGLNQKLQAENALLKQQNDLLAKRMDVLEAEVKALARSNR
jgi:trimeric autotransporter adhesin